MHLKLALRKILCANNCKKSFTPFSRQRLHPTLDFLIKKAAVICSQAINMRKNGGGDGGWGKKKNLIYLWAKRASFPPRIFCGIFQEEESIFPPPIITSDFSVFSPEATTYGALPPAEKKKEGKNSQIKFLLRLFSLFTYIRMRSRTLLSLKEKGREEKKRGKSLKQKRCLFQ